MIFRVSGIRVLGKYREDQEGIGLMSSEYKQFDSTFLRAVLGDSVSIRGPISANIPEETNISFSIDSRTIKPGQFFVAIKGARDDGHFFLPDALARGAAGIIISRA